MIAIIGILAGMLLPALSSAREKSRRAVCAGNLKQIGLAAHMYANDHNDCWPLDTGSSAGTIWNGGNYLHFGKVIENGYIPAGVFYCPSATRNLMNDPITGAQNLGVTNAATRGTYYFRGPPQGAPLKIDTTIMAQAADQETTMLTNHKRQGVTTLYSDGSVKFVVTAGWVDPTSGYIFSTGNSNPWAYLDGKY